MELRDFRNYGEAHVEVPAGLTALAGPNAQGKTNLLEAVHYLLTLGSPRTAADQPLVREGAESAYVRGEVESERGRVLVEVQVRPSGANRVLLNRSPVRRRRDLRERVRSVFFIPEDLSIVQGGPEERRRFLDDAAHGLWPGREAEARAFERALRQRNRLLKEHDAPGAPPALEAWDEELVVHGAAVTDARRAAVERVEPPSREAYRVVSESPLVVRYRPSVEGEKLEQAFRERLAERRGDELLRRTTLVGPHRDELDLAVEGRVARRFASHGETWGAALCLRLGVAEAIAVEVGDPPVRLLDDPFSGLDPERRGRLSAALAGGGGQAILAVPDASHAPPGSTVWEVMGGRVVS